MDRPAYGRARSRNPRLSRRRTVRVLLQGGTRLGRKDTAPRTNPLWRKAPLVLLRYPGLLVSLALGAFLLVTATAVYPLFLSASATRLLATETNEPTVTRYGSGVWFRNGTMPIPQPGEERPPADRVDAAFRRLTADPNLDPVVRSINGPVVQVASPASPDETRSTHLFAGAGARSNVTLLAGGGEGGAWVPDLVAGALGLQPGDVIDVTSRNDRGVTLRVTGVYSSLYKGGAAGYWHPWYDDFILYCGDCAPPPQPLIVPNDRFVHIAHALRIDHAAYSWVAPARPDLTLEQAGAVAARFRAITARINDPGTPEHEMFGTCYVSFFCNPRNGPAIGTSITTVLEEVEARLTTIEGPARLLRFAGLLVALVVVAAAGAYSVSARRVEATLLDARGFGPTAAAARGALEAVIPSVLGGLFGLGLSIGVVTWFGPGRVDGSAEADSIRGAIVAVGVAVAAIGIVSALAFVYHPQRDRTRRAGLGALPWEIAVIAVSIWLFLRLRSSGAFAIDPQTQVRSPRPLLLVFPVAFLAGFATLAARGFAILARWLRGRSDRVRASLSLAAHRLAGAAGLTVLLVGAAGLCLGLFVQSEGVVGSIQESVHAKAELYVGSDVQARIDFRNTLPERFPMPYTRVTRRLQAGTLIPSRNRFGDPFDLLAIDPRTFASAAYWNKGFADEPLTELIRPLSSLQGGRVPVIVVAGPTANPTAIAIDQIQVPVVVVGRASGFPGETSLRPLLVVSQDALLQAAADAPNPLDEVGSSTELWIRGDPARARAALATNLPYQPDVVLTAAEVQDIPYIAATIDTFRVMDWLGIASASLVIVATLMYLQARQRSQVVSYGLSLRMGMPSSGHRRALEAELGAILGVALVAGVAFGLIASRLVVPLLDPLPAIPPDPLYLVPVVAVLIAVPVVAGLAAAGSWLTELRARRADLGQVMRVAE